MIVFASCDSAMHNNILYKCVVSSTTDKSTEESV